MELNKIYCEPCNDTIKRMPDGFIDSVITSPPYWQLRDYGWSDQWGLEPTYQEYLDHLWSMMDGIWRVLKPEGTVWINLGDTYNNSSAGNKTWGDGVGSNSHYMESAPKNKKPQSVKTKCLLLIPHRFAIGCIERGWIVRNDIIWAKRNGMPESVTDRFSKKHEYFFFMVKSEKYYFDLDAIRDKHKWGDKDKRADGKRHESKGLCESGQYSTNAVMYNEKGKNPGSVSDFWDGYKKPTFEEYMNICKEYYYSDDDFFDIPTRPSKEKHYASYNDSLLVKPVLSGCPEGGIIYDPFMGTGSTAEVALRSGRKYIGSEGNTEYCKIAHKRLLPYLQQQTLF